jgi:prepilin-type processing-associated H-X9-DG protein
MDENPISINDPSIAIPAATTGNGGYLIDYPSGNHGESGAIAFADGHAIVHRWQNPETYTPRVSQGQGGNPTAQPIIDANNSDLVYLAHIASAPRN